MDYVPSICLLFLTLKHCSYHKNRNTVFITTFDDIDAIVMNLSSNIAIENCAIEIQSMMDKVIHNQNVLASAFNCCN